MNRKCQNKNIKQTKSKINRPKSFKANNSISKEKKLNNIIHINLFQLPLDDINEELKDIRKIINKTETSRERNHKVLIKNTNNNIKKEKIIISLKKELKFQKLMNKNLLHFKDYADKNFNYYKKNYDDICKYRIQLHEDLSDFMNLCSNYEKQKNDYENENNMMIKTNENILNYKKKENINLQNRLNKLNDDIQTQKGTIETLTNMIDKYINIHKEYNKNIEKNEYAHDERYENLLNNYKRMENEYKYYFDLEIRNRKNILDEKNGNLYGEEEGMALLNLSEKQVKSEYLKKIIKEIQNQINEIQQINKKINNNKDLEKLLGKRGAEKYKKRMKEKINNNSSIKNKNNKYKLTY